MESTENKPAAKPKTAPPAAAAGTEPYDFAANREQAHPTSYYETLFHLLKGCLGAGLLAMPKGFYNAGYTFGIIATCVVAVICTHCINMLIHTAHLTYRRHEIPALTYPELVTTVFANGPERLRKFSTAAGIYLASLIVLDLLACCVLYSLFAAGLIQQVVAFHTGCKLDIRLYVAMLWLPFVFQNLIRNLKYLVPFSLIADLCILLGVVITFYFLTEDLASPSSRQQVAPIERMPLFFGLVIFALECVGVIMSLENNMKNPKQMIGTVGVLNIGMLITTLLYIFVGSFGYLKYGDATEANISLNLPADRPLAESVKIMIGIAVFLSHALAFYPPFEIIWKALGKKFSDERRLKAEYATRIILVTLTSLIGIAVPTLGPCISLVGSVCLSFMGLIIPAVLETMAFWNDPGLGRFYWRLWKNGAIIVFGLFGFCVGTYVSILEIIEEYSTKSMTGH